MLATTQELRGFAVTSADEEIGEVEDYYFDRKYWVTRYLVVDTGNWLVERDILISPEAVDEIDYGNQSIKLNISPEEIKEGPFIEKEEKLKRAHERDLADYFNWTNYWRAAEPTNTGISGLVPNNLVRKITIEENIKDREKDSNKIPAEEDTNLRSVNELINFKIHAIDGFIGHVDKFIIDDNNWLVRYLVVDTKDLLPGKKVVLAPEWITNIDWVREEVEFNLNVKEIENAPEYDAEMPISELYETKLYEYYDKEKYWE